MSKLTREFEAWAQAMHLSLSKSDSPACWRGSQSAIAEWEKHPYNHPYTNGAYCAWQHLCQTIEAQQQEIARLKERTAKLEARLEMDHAYDQDGRRVEIPAADRDKYPDGISCRDETIRLQDEAVDKLQRQLAEAQARIIDLEATVSSLERWKAGQIAAQTELEGEP